MSGRLHYSFLEAPTGYKTRLADPPHWRRGVTFADYSTPNSEGKMIELVRRHRLEKKNPNAAMSDPKEPIVYYLDAAVPEPIRSAMKEGFLWWNKAFEAAGFTNALVIKDAPLDMDPMDVRYNQLYWVNRDERGFSTGGGCRTRALAKSSRRACDSSLIVSARRAPIGKPINQAPAVIIISSRLLLTPLPIQKYRWLSFARLS